jgi:hypothetical protein
MKDLPSKSELVARLKSPSRIRAAGAVRRLITDHGMTQRAVAKAGDRSLRWVNAMSRWTPDKASPFGATTKAERVSHAKRMRYKRRNRKRRAQAPGTRKTTSDWQSHSLKGRSRSMPAFNHEAFTPPGRTLYPKTVLKVITDATRILKPGNYCSKLGRIVRNGDWKDKPLYYLAFEERATCPTSCDHWCDCYGNTMHRLQRMPHGPELEARLPDYVAWLAEIVHPKGFVVRLHETGDFYSLAYFEIWRDLLARHRNLYIYGYTRCWDVNHPKWGPIAAALIELSQADNWDRFRMRYSDLPPELGLVLPDGEPMASTISIQHPCQVADDPTTIVCPQEEGRNESCRPPTCSQCGLCMNTKERIALITKGQSKEERKIISSAASAQRSQPL